MMLGARGAGCDLMATLDIAFDFSIVSPLPPGMDEEMSVTWTVELAVDPERLDAVEADAWRVSGSGGG